MKSIIISIFLACIFCFELSAQTGATFYQSTDNIYYWKNRKPFEGYWQQDIYYNIKANIDEKTDMLTGEEELTYWNNSPDTLSFVFFHLYENAFQPGSYYDAMQKSLGQTPQYGSYEEQKLGISVENISSAGTELKTEKDNTILKVFLLKPLKSGESITFKIKFKTWFDISANWRRMHVFNDYGFKHYNGGHWYPRICVYDKEFGWETSQHLGHEFYGDFGAYDVELTFANNFIVDATGVLQNESEMLPDTLKAKLDIKNFKDKPLNETPSIIIPYDSTLKKTWKFHADNVHDFAFLADPFFRIGTAEWNGIKCVALAMESNASKWQNAAEYTAKVIKFYSENFGKYCYPKIIVADAESGMEYPMLTMDGGIDPDYKYVIAHEVGHNWFFGQVGNNETYRAALDEGFTVFITTYFLDSISKSEVIETPEKSWFKKLSQKKLSPADKWAYYYYYDNAMKTEGVQLNTHSDMFGSTAYGSVYRQVYNKTSTMLYNLKYVLGDSLFMGAMKNYFEKWKFAHPYFQDFRDAITEYSKTDLTWFFDEWLETNKTIDYAVTSVKKEGQKDSFNIIFKRKGLMQMPIDFTVLSKTDSVYNFYIPNTWFTKKTNATILPKWYGFNSLKKKYKATVSIPGGISNVLIDPTNRLADINYLDNSKRFPISLAYDANIYNQSNHAKYELFAGPNIWWNGYDGLKLGLDLNGGYFNYKNKFDASVWFNSGVFQNSFDTIIDINEFENISYLVDYTTPLNHSTFINLNARDLDGVNSYTAEIEKWNAHMNSRVYANINTHFIENSNDTNYFFYPDEWGVSSNPDKVIYNNSVTIGAENYYYNKIGYGVNALKIRSSAFNSFYNFVSVSASSTNYKSLGKLQLNTRIFAQYSFGNSIANESSLYLAGANPEELIKNRITRSAGIVPDEWTGFGADVNHFTKGGGLNLRGYSGYLVAEPDKDGNLHFIYKGHSGAAINAELEFNRLFGFVPQFLPDYLTFNTYLFGDAGIISINDIGEKLELSLLRADAGVGACLIVKQWGQMDKLKPFTIRFDMPLFLNRIPAVEDKYFKFRWMLGVGKTF
jgi:hypothetical protein